MLQYLSTILGVGTITAANVLGLIFTLAGNVWGDGSYIYEAFISLADAGEECTDNIALGIPEDEIADNKAGNPGFGYQKKQTNNSQSFPEDIAEAICHPGAGYGNTRVATVPEYWVAVEKQVEGIR